MKKIVKTLTVLAVTLILSGCTLFINDNGRDPGDLPSRDPVNLTITADIDVFDVTVTPEEQLYMGDSVTVVLDAYDDNYAFVAFKDAATNAVLSHDETFQFLIEADTALHIVFEEKPPSTHALSLESNLERAQFNLDAHTTHVAESVISLDVNDPDGYFPFVAWEDELGTVVSTDKAFDFTLDEPTTLNAVFDLDFRETVTLNLESNLESAVFNFEATTTHLDGDSVHLSVHDANQYYPFVAWENAKGTVVSTDKSFDFTLDSDATLKAVFDLDYVAQYTLELVSNLNRASFNKDAIFTALDGDVVTVSVEDPEAEYPFLYWEDTEGNVLSTDAIYEFTVDEPALLRAVFELDYTPIYTLTLDSNLDSAVFNLDETTTHDEGALVVVSVEDGDGYYPFIRYETLSGTVLGHDKTLELTLDRNYTVIAVFDLDYVDEYTVELQSNLDTAVFNHPVISTHSQGETLTIVVNDPDDYYPFIAWEDAEGNLISDTASFDHTLTADVTFVAIFDLYEAPSTAYSTGFDDGHKAAYAGGSVVQNGRPWYFEDALTGSLDADQYNGMRSVRIRDGHIETEFSIPYVREVEFLYGRYLSDNPSPVMFEVSLDRNTWIMVEDELMADEPLTLYVATFDDGLYETLGLTFGDALYFRIRADSNGERVNIDDFSVTVQNPLSDPSDDDNGGDEDTSLPDYVDPALLEMDLDPYYSDVEGLYGEDLMFGLRGILQQTVALRTYGEARDILQETDVCPADDSQIRLIYLEICVAAEWDSGQTWNREHVWPQSLLGVSTNNSSTHEGSDLHNLAPADPGENSSRGNKYFAWQTTTSTYEPPNNVKGDVARMMFYMDVMYEHLMLVEGAPGTYEMGDLITLLEWHLFDPVDAYELNRNDVIASYQGNRNPFIDYPHFVVLIWYEYEEVFAD